MELKNDKHGKHDKAGILFQQIQVHSIDTASGIFIGNNRAIGWSSHKKSNYGFGYALDASVCGNSHVIWDNDLIDAPIDDHDIHVNSASRCLSNNQIGFEEIRIQSLGSNSTVAVGENAQNAWSSHSKNNMGQGRMNGLNLSKSNCSAVMDNDMIDAPIADRDIGK